MTQNTHRLLSAANTVNATSVTTVPSKLTGINGFNAGTVTYLKLYDKASAPSETDTPRQTYYLAANANFSFDWPGMMFGAGIAYRMTTAAADNSTAAVAAGAVLCLNLDYI